MGASPLPSIRNRVLAGGVSTASGSGQTVSSGFAFLLVMRGAGGGLGASVGVPAAGGRGGGVIYIECEELEFSGALTANGGDGVSVAGADNNPGGGGGGGGGMILIRTHAVIEFGDRLR